MDIPPPEQVYALAVRRGKYKRDRTFIQEIEDIHDEYIELHEAARNLKNKKAIENKGADIVLTIMSIFCRHGLDLEGAINRKYRHHGGE